MAYVILVGWYLEETYASLFIPRAQMEADSFSFSLM